MFMDRVEYGFIEVKDEATERQIEILKRMYGKNCIIIKESDVDKDKKLKEYLDKI